MKQKRNSLRQLLWIFVVTILIASFHACDDDDIRRVVSLQYMEIGDIGTGMTFEAKPYTRGNLTDFTISQIKCNGEVKEVSGFAIHAENGVITLVHNNTLEPGLYTLTVSCKVNGIPETFQDVLTVNLLAPAPQVFKYKSPLITFEYGYRDTAYVSEISESVTIQKFILSKEGDSPYFQIDGTTGTITLNPNNKFDEPWPGHYKPTVGIVTPAGTQYYPGIVEFNITSKPLGLTYTPDSIQVEQNGSDTSKIAILKGSPDELVYTLNSVTPNTDQIKIEPSTGRIYLEKNNTPAIGKYSIGVTATNKYGTATFSNVFYCNIITYIEAISDFSYSAVSSIRTKALEINKSADFKGGYVTFAFSEPLPAALADLTIDAATGKISAEEGNKIPVGDYAIKVKASNNKSSAETTLQLTITEHPNAFKLVYGNNLGLTPMEDYANQFSYKKADTVTITPVNTPSNTTFTIVDRYSSNSKSHSNVSGKFDASINASTGQLDIITAGLGAGNMGYILIEATKGSGENAYTVRVPVFIQNRSGGKETDKNSYGYAPFVVKVNPKNGGTGTAPILDNTDMQNAGSNLRIDLKDQMVYCDFRADFSALSSKNGAAPGVSDSPLLKTLWERYYNQEKYSDKAPISGISDPNRNSDKPCYISQTDYKLYVNPDKWKDANGNYVNGVFWARATAATNGSDPGSSNALFVIAIWFDPEF